MSVINTLPGPVSAPAVNSALRYSVAEYHRMIDAGYFADNERVELIEGRLVNKMPRNPPHDGTLFTTQKCLFRLGLVGWDVRIQSGVTLIDSEPEPDLAVVREDANDYKTRHPGPADAGLVIEVADSSLAFDRGDKCRIYARAGIVTYWIINVVDQQIEVYESPSGPTANPKYGQRTDYVVGDRVAVVLDGVTAGTIAVADILP